MGRPRITVITTNLNSSEFLERHLCSVIDQAYESLEHIVIDGGSSDGSLDILDLYRDELSHCVTLLGGSRADALNRGLRLATGDIIAIVSSNDLLLPGALHAVADAMAGPHSPGWVIADAQIISDADLTDAYLDAERPASLATYLMRTSGLIPRGASFVARTLFERHGAFDASFEHAAEYEYECRLLAYGITPRELHTPTIALRQIDNPRMPQVALRRGMEYILAAQKYAHHTTIGERYALWRTLEHRRRILALAQVEMASESPRMHLLGSLFTHPWWLADASIRHALLHGMAHTTPRRKAA
jgi:glycosyltransferase involved in cell wall biosynthesis